MKTNSLLSLALLAVLASSASAATQSDVVAMPTLVVTAPRYSSAEQNVNASLSALRQQASVPVYSSVALPALKAQVAQAPAAISAARVAKF